MLHRMRRCTSLQQVILLSGIALRDSLCHFNRLSGIQLVFLFIVIAHQNNKESKADGNEDVNEGLDLPREEKRIGKR